MLAKEKKTQLILHEEEGKSLENKNAVKDWSSYNRKTNRLTKEYTDKARFVKEQDDASKSWNTAEEFTDHFFREMGKTKTFSMPRNYEKIFNVKETKT